MGESDDDYERERQENIRKNQELLLSLGLNSNKSNKNRSRPTVAKEKRRRDEEWRASREASSGSSGSPPRSSARLSTRPKKSYAPIKRVKEIKEKPAPRVGSRKSSRISDSAGVPRSYNEDNEDAFVEVLSRRAPVSTLKRLQNPLPPARIIDDEDLEHEVEYSRAPLPGRDAHGDIIFENNNRHFRPNVTPEEMLRGGIFGGTAFRPFYSSVVKQQLSPQEDLEEFPSEWYNGLDQDLLLTSTQYDPSVNRFGVKAGQTLEEWEQNGWIRRQDPRGWWQWYFRFYLGRRTSDDARQISRFSKACGPSGRFKRMLVSKIHNSNATFDDETISPVVRQTLFHWAYSLTEVDYNAYLP